MDKTAWLNEKRNRQKLRFRLWEGIKSSVLPPLFGLIPILVLTALFCVGLLNRTIFFKNNIPGVPYKVFDYITIAVLVSVFLAVLLALLVLLGTPYKSRTAENAALSVFKLQSTPSECPILISSKCVTFGRRRWEFFSMWVTLEEWQQRTNYSKILNSLGCHLVGHIEHGGKKQNNCQRIVLFTRPGAMSFQEAELTDEQI